MQSDTSEKSVEFLHHTRNDQCPICRPKWEKILKDHQVGVYGMCYTPTLNSRQAGEETIDV